MSREESKPDSKIKTSLKRWFVKQLIKFKWIKESVYTEQELNDLLVGLFPVSFDMDFRGSKGELTILSTELHLPQLEQHINFQLYCSFMVRVKSVDTYRAHIFVSGNLQPYYDDVQKVIKLTDVTLNETRLVNDDYAFIRSGNELINAFVPMGGLFSKTMKLTFSVLKGILPSDIVSYLGLYTAGSKQKVLDYHKPEIENILVEQIEQGNWNFALDENDFEQQLFSELGREVTVENGQLVFKFH